MQDQAINEKILEQIKEKFPPETPEVLIEKIFEKISEELPELSPRNKVSNATGGAVSPKYLANADSAGFGIQPRMRMGGKVVYPKEAVIAWLKKRCQIF